MAKKKTFENVISNLLGEPVSNLCHAFYDQYVEANVKFRSKAGMKTVIIRRQLGKCCEWCANLAGIYTPEKAPADIYRRHDNCKCMVTYKDENGYTDVWSKKEFQSQKEARKARENELVNRQKRNGSKSPKEARKAREKDILKGKDVINTQKRTVYEERKRLANIGNDDIITDKKKGILLISELEKEQFASIFLEDPSQLSHYNPITLKKELEARGFDVQPLGHGSKAGIPFEKGGGYIIRYSGNGAIEYHPAKNSRHGGRYYRLSDAKHGRRWFDTNGREIDKDASNKVGRRVYK